MGSDRINVTIKIRVRTIICNRTFSGKRRKNFKFCICVNEPYYKILYFYR